MAKLEFEDLSFEQNKDSVRVIFLNLFYFDVKNSDLNKISDFTVEKNAIDFKKIDEKRAGRKFNIILEQGFSSLKNKLTGKKAVYIHKNSGIPLIGNGAFGLVDRNTNVIEVKPITSCNLGCIYCSVDQNKRIVDFVIEKDYLIEEFKKLVEFKQVINIEAHIASQGEPLLYAPIVDLVKDIAEIKQVKTISIDTNGSLLTKELVDKLVEAGLTRFNLSINALEPALAKKIADSKFYDIKKIKEIAEYISKRCSLIIAPVLVPGVNDEEIPKLVEFAKSINADIGIQNFLPYKFGLNPVKPLPFEVFYKKLQEWEDKYKVKLIKSVDDFNIKETKQLPKPFNKDEVIDAEIACDGRLPGEKIAVAKGRTISIPNCGKEKGKVRIKITRAKHNIFIGVTV